jgi:hypothetical protein
MSPRILPAWLASLAALSAVACAVTPGDDPGSGAGGSGQSTGAGGAGVGGGPGGDGVCVDTCTSPPAGITVGCEKRFLYGVNYAWASFAGDFGNSMRGVAAQKAQRLASLQDMKANGVDVVRWWVFPNFSGGGVTFDASGAPSALGGTFNADVAAALDDAAQAGVHIQFTLFSFDTFKTMLNATTVNPHNLAAIINSPAQLAALVSNVVAPFARQVSASPNRDRVAAWDIINEPEWAISGSDGVDPPFSPQSTVTTVPYPTMLAFVKAVEAGLHGASDRPVTIGAAAIQWGKAWAGVGDFYTFHLYDWINANYPYNRPPSDYGVTDKPVVLGEFPIQGLTGVPYATLVGAILNVGYAGATAWSFNDRNFPWAPNKANVKAFADQQGCAVQY